MIRSAMKTPAPRIVFMASLWTLDGHPSPQREWSLEQKIRAIAKAGFDAVATAATPELVPLLRALSLRFSGFFASSDPRQFNRLVSAQRLAGAENINVQLGKEDASAKQAIGWMLALRRETRRQGIYASLETHRDTATETPEKLYALAKAYHRATGELLPITWDLSHLAVVKHLKPFLFSKVLLQEPKLIQAARLMHCRPFNGQHAQIPVFTYKIRLTPEFKTWLEFVEDLFRCWLAGPRPGGELWICPEIGPASGHGYNLSIMPSSWAQAIVCKNELAKLWHRLGGATSHGK